MDLHKHYIRCHSKEASALFLLRANPAAWTGDVTLEELDLALLKADPVPFINYSKGSFLRKLYPMNINGVLPYVDWTVENDQQCRDLTVEAGGISQPEFPKPKLAPTQYTSMVANINVTATPKFGFVWGYLSTQARNVRIFKGPSSTCPSHPWDATILRDCTPNTDNLAGVENVADYRWDVLCMKMCEDYDYPWVVVAARSAGPPPGPEPCRLP